MKALYKLNVNEFTKLVEDLHLTNWLIRDDSASSRKKQVENRPYFVDLKQRAEAEGITASDDEIISWLDTLNLLYYVFDRVDDDLLNRLQVIQEYVIPFTHKRADYLLVSSNKILILEFSYDKRGTEYKFEKKLTQAIYYKELLSNLLPSYIQIGTYTFLINPEADLNGANISKYNKYNKYRNSDDFANNEKISDLGAYINFFFSNRDDALLQLSFIDGYETGLNEALEGDED